MSTSVRSLALSLRLSPATISAALSGRGRIAPATVARVKKAAAAAGYRHNPLAGTLMSEMRRSRGSMFRGVLAVLDLHEPERPVHGPFHRELHRGAKERAGKLGFKVEQFEVGRGGLTMLRLDTILQSRGIHGLLLLPSWRAPDFSALDWSRYSGAYTDYNLTLPGLHSMCSDHYLSMMQTLERLHARGYRRPGLVIEHERNERLHRRHTAAFQSFYQERLTEAEHVSPLIVQEVSERAFERWFRNHQPDVVLCHNTAVLDWMQACGARIPDTHGFVCLNVVHEARPSAGLDLQPREIGARGIELVIAQLHRNERGVPDSATRTTIPALWMEGPTLKCEVRAGG